MDALKMPAVSPTADPLGRGGAVVLATDERTLTPRMMLAFSALLEALEYALDLETSTWDFAVDLATLRRLKLTDSDLRWLLVRGLVDHGLEVTPPRDANRSFRRSEQTVFRKRSCFVLTPEGSRLARELRGNAAPSNGRSEHSLAEPATGDALQSRIPHWDRDRRELRIGGVVVKRFTIPLVDLESILTAFEEQAWPDRIDDPLPTSDEPLRKNPPPGSDSFTEPRPETAPHAVRGRRHRTRNPVGTSKRVTPLAPVPHGAGDSYR